MISRLFNLAKAKLKGSTETVKETTKAVYKVAEKTE